MVLVGGDGGEASLGEHEGAVGHGGAGRRLRLRAPRTPRTARTARQVHHVQPRLVAVHRVQDYLHITLQLGRKSFMSTLSPSNLIKGSGGLDALAYVRASALRSCGYR